VSRLLDVARKGLRRVPLLTHLGRRTYFATTNHRLYQAAAYQLSLVRDRQRPVLSAPLSASTPPPTISVVVDVHDTGTAAAVRLRRELVRQGIAGLQVVVTDSPGQSSPTSRAERLTSALEECSGDFVCFLDGNDVVYPGALAELAGAVAGSNQADVCYGGEDEARLSRTGSLQWRRSPFFKPAWNPELLRSLPYLGHLTLLRTSLVRQLGIRALPGAEIWDLHLRVTDRARRIVCVPGIVAGRVDGRPTVALAASAAIESLQQDAAVHGRPDAVVGTHRGTWLTRFPVAGAPLVSIVIPSKNQLDVVRRCVTSLLEVTTYVTYEVVLVDTGSTDEAVWDWYGTVADVHPEFRVVSWPEQPFSYARSCNAGAAAAKGDVLVMLNNDTEIVAPQWLDLLVGEVQNPEVGSVGALLLYPDGHTIQHAGISVGIRGAAGNALAGLAVAGRLTRTQSVMLNSRHAMTALTAACLAIRADVFADVGGFDEQFRVTFNDVDLGCRLTARGLRNVYRPDVTLLHHESLSVGVAQSRDWDELYAAAALLRDRWPELVARDPHFNPLLSRQSETFRLP